MNEDSGEENFRAKAMNIASKRKFDYSFSSTDEEDEDAKDSDDSIDEIKTALVVNNPQLQLVPAPSQMQKDGPIHSKVIAEEEASAEE